MFGLLHNLYVYCKKRSERKITLVLIGLDGAGKTTLFNTLQGDLDKETIPSFGFMTATIQHGKDVLELFDLGGGKNIRGTWSRYGAEVHGVIFVVDAADPMRFSEASSALLDALKDEHLHGKSLLIFANKQDLPTAVQASVLAQELRLVEGVQNTFNIIPCAAKVPPGSRTADPRVSDGIRWLVSNIKSNYSTLNARVQREAELVRAEEARKKKEREERLRKAREERLRAQALEQEQQAAALPIPDLQSVPAASSQQEPPLQPPPSQPPDVRGLPQLLPPLPPGSQPPGLQHGENALREPKPFALPDLGLPNAIESPGKPLHLARQFPGAGSTLQPSPLQGTQGRAYSHQSLQPINAPSAAAPLPPHVRTPSLLSDTPGTDAEGEHVPGGIGRPSDSGSSVAAKGLLPASGLAHGNKIVPFHPGGT